ncbi:hypothetical protein TNCV_212401 [Trichonephila clavipes]|nr:hypothetical protein TNCV_212401 [Trichonephila clavipes]
MSNPIALRMKSDSAIAVRKQWSREENYGQPPPQENYGQPLPQENYSPTTHGSLLTEKTTVFTTVGSIVMHLQQKL